MQVSAGDDFLVKLTALLREHGQTLFRGTNKLCLTASSLVFLNYCFEDLRNGAINNQESSTKLQGVKCIPYLQEFFNKAVFLKVVPGTCSQFDVLINVSCFRALRVLEIKKVPVGYITGLQSLRPHLVALTCTRSVHVAISHPKISCRQLHNRVWHLDCEGSFQNNEVFLSCGGDLVSKPMPWRQLEEVNFSHNSIEQLDDSLKLLPSLQFLNLSHNSITSPGDSSVWEHLSEISHLNLGYNGLSNVPTISDSILTSLVLRNNNLHNLEGLQSLRLLKMLDVSNNCITSISELAPLAYLCNLTSLYLEGNPISFHRDYRLNTVARLYPVPRYEPIMLDGKQLTNSELPILGCSVLPDSLLSYIHERSVPRDRPNMEHLTNNVADSSLDECSANEEQHQLKKKTRRGRRAVAREICIENTDDGTMTPDEEVITPSAEHVLEHTEDLRKLEKLRKLGGDDWLPGIDSVVNPEGNKSTEEENGFPSEGIDAVVNPEGNKSTEEENGFPSEELPTPLPRTLSKLSYTEDHYTGNSRNSSISITSLSDEDVSDDHRFVVSLVSPADEGDASPFFIFIKGQDLFEMDLNGRVVCRLELHCLRDIRVDETPDCQPVARLKFDYVNRNRQTRQYALESKEQREHLMEILLPKMESNTQETGPQVEYMQCLKCSAHFTRLQKSSSDVICPDCGDTRIISMSPPALQDSSPVGLNVSSIKSVSSSMGATHLEQMSSSPAKRSPLTLNIESGFANIPVEQPHSPASQSTHMSIANSDNVTMNQNVVTSASPARTSALSTAIQESTRTAPPRPAEDNVANQTPFACWTQARNVVTSSSYGAQANCAAGRYTVDGVSIVKPSNSRSLEVSTTSYSLPSEAKTDSSRLCSSSPATKIPVPLGHNKRLSDSTPTSTEPVRVSLSVSPIPNILKNLFSNLSGRMSSASGSSSDSRGGSSCNSRVSTPITHIPRLDFRISADDFTSCDHRLKLYFELSLFTEGANEDFRCLLMTSVVIYGEFEEMDCVLVSSNMMFYLCKLTAKGSGSPDECLTRLARHSLDELQFIDFGLGNQSFYLEFSNACCCYHFRVRDKVRCQKFLTLFTGTVDEAKHKTCSKPVSVTKCNPQSLAHIRSQVLGVTEKESPLTVGRRLHEQALYFTDPPLIKDRKFILRNYSHCFVGKEFVDWLLKGGEVDGREKAADLGQRLLEGGAVENVSPKEGAFEDKDHYYRFTEQSNSGEDETSVECSESDLDTSVVLYLSAMFTTNMKRPHEDLRAVGVVVTRTHIALAEENPRWPIPRYLGEALRPKVPEFVCIARYKITDVAGLENPRWPIPRYLGEALRPKVPEFVCIARYKITDVAGLDFYGDGPCYVGISISDEDAPLECADSQWLLKTETASCLSSLIQVIKEPWEAQFGVELQQTLHPALVES